MFKSAPDFNRLSSRFISHVARVCVPASLRKWLERKKTEWSGFLPKAKKIYPWKENGEKTCPFRNRVINHVRVNYPPSLHACSRQPPLFLALTERRYFMNPTCKYVCTYILTHMVYLPKGNIMKIRFRWNDTVVYGSVVITMIQQKSSCHIKTINKWQFDISLSCAERSRHTFHSYLLSVHIESSDILAWLCHLLMKTYAKNI